jgi:polyketide cyclase/dehydrase/lipid transport protein
VAAYTIEESAVIPAPPERVYGIVADYRGGHPRILPKQMHDLVVEQGGVGDGTVIRFQMTVLGGTHTLRAVITEPEPGRVLVERYPETGNVTTFIADPLDGGRATRMTISTVMRAKGVRGAVERLLLQRILPPIYREELGLLAKVAAERS